METFEEILFMEEKERYENASFAWLLDKKFPGETLIKIIKDIYVKKIEKTDELIKNEFSEYNLLHKQGVAFKGRQESLNLPRIEFLKAKKAELQAQAKSFKVRPLKEWVRRLDFYQIKRIGFRRFLEVWFDLAVINTNDLQRKVMGGNIG